MKKTLIIKIKRHDGKPASWPNIDITGWSEEEVETFMRGVKAEYPDADITTSTITDD